MKEYDHYITALTGELEAKRLAKDLQSFFNKPERELHFGAALLNKDLQIFQIFAYSSRRLIHEEVHELQTFANGYKSGNFQRIW